MSITVNTNLASLAAQRSLFDANSTLTVSMQRLSTGLRINSATDDAAGLALANKISSQLSSSDIAKNNALTAINLVQTAESDISIIQENLQRMRDLAVQAANGVYSTSERKMLNAEYAARLSELDRVSNSSSFSEKKLLDGSFSSMAVQVGVNNTANDRIMLTTTTFRDFGVGAAGGPIPSSLNNAISTLTNAQNAIANISAAITAISTSRANMGALVNRIQGSIKQIETRKENMQSALSVIQDADIAQEAASMTRSQILKQAAVSVLQQANSQPQLALTLLR